jgi:hypothetical protein
MTWQVRELLGDDSFPVVTGRASLLSLYFGNCERELRAGEGSLATGRRRRDEWQRAVL